LRITLNLLTVQKHEPIGVERFVRNVVGSLSFPADTQVTVLLPRGVAGEHALGSAFFSENPRVRIRRVPLLGTITRILMELIWLSWRCRKEDVVFSVNNTGPLFGKRSQRRIVVVHDIWFLSDRYDSSWFSRLAFSLLIRLQVRRTHNLVTVSEASKQEIANILSVDPRRIEVVPNCVSLELNAGDEATGATSNGYYLLVGSDRPNKNVSNAVVAFRRYVEDAGSSEMMYCVGKYNSVFAREMENLASMPGGTCVKVKGFVDDHELEELLNSALGVVYVSLYEGFGLPVVEAIAAGKPIMVSQGTVCEELAGQAGVVVDGQAIQSIAEGFRRLKAKNLQQVRDRAREITDEYGDCRRIGARLRTVILGTERAGTG